MAANELVSREEDNLRNYSSWIDVTVLDEQTRKVAYRFEMPFSLGGKSWNRLGTRWVGEKAS